MKAQSQVGYLERVFTRSCLETSVVIDRMPRFISMAGKSSWNRTHTQLHQLKRQLLRDALEATPQAHLFKRLCGAANHAAELAWETSFPLLAFPCLFDELIVTAHAARPATHIEVATASFPFPRPELVTATA